MEQLVQGQGLRQAHLRLVAPLQEQVVPQQEQEALQRAHEAPQRALVGVLERLEAQVQGQLVQLELGLAQAEAQVLELEQAVEQALVRARVLAQEWE